MALGRRDAKICACDHYERRCFVKIHDARSTRRAKLRTTKIRAFDHCERRCSLADAVEFLRTQLEKHIGVVLANDRYESLARTAIPLFLVCATTLKDNGTASDPFLLVVLFPTTFPERIHSKQHLGQHESRDARARQRSGGQDYGVAFDVVASLVQKHARRECSASQ